MDPSITPGLVTPSLQWSSSLPWSFEVLFVCLPDDVIAFHAANMSNPSESSVSGDNCDRFREEGFLAGLYILLESIFYNNIANSTFLLSVTFALSVTKRHSLRNLHNVCYKASKFVLSTQRPLQGVIVCVTYTTSVTRRQSLCNLHNVRYKASQFA